MAETFKDLPNKMHELAAKGGDQQTQSYSSSFQQAMGDDGKLHKRESKEGSKMSCHNGHCQETVCKNGVCHERTFEEKPGKETDAKPAKLESEVPAREVDVERPQVVDSEELQRVLQKVKEQMAAHGQGGDVVVKIVSIGRGHAKQEENVPVPPPAFAPKDK